MLSCSCCSIPKPYFQNLTNLQQSEVFTPSDNIAIDYFRFAKTSEIDEFALWWGEGRDLASFIRGDFLPSNRKIIDFSISQNGFQEIAKILAKDRPELLANVINTILISEYDRVEIAKIIIQEGEPKQFLKYFKYYSIRDPKLLEELSKILAESRPDLFIKNDELFQLKDASLKERLIATSVTDLKYITSGKIREFVNKYLSTLPLSQTAGIVDRTDQKLLGAESSSVENQLFNAFKRISEDPSKTILYCDVCGETNAVLLEAIFGKEKTTDKKQLNLQATQENVDHIISIIKENENKFKGTSPSHFMAYSISFGMEHAFVIIQFRENDGSIKYRLLQSWMGEHNLKSYMEQRSSSLNQDEFNSFSERLKHVLVGPKWTQKDAMFYKKYFMTHLNWRVGSKKVPWSFNPKIKLISDLTVIYGPSDLEKMKLQ